MYIVGEDHPKQRELDDYYMDMVVFSKGKWRSLEPIHRILLYLRAHMELCESPDYKRFYDECFYYMVSDMEVQDLLIDSNFEKTKEWLEHYYDLQNKTSESPIEEDKHLRSDLDAFLLRRKCLHWGKRPPNETKEP